MKTLKDFIIESIGEKNVDSKEDVKNAEPVENLKIKFSFKDLEGGEEVKKEIIEVAQKVGLTFENDEDNMSIEFDFAPNNDENVNEIINILSKYCSKIRSSQKRSSDEQYAQKTKKFEEKINKVKEYFSKTNSNEEE